MEGRKGRQRKQRAEDGRQEAEGRGQEERMRQ
jgi:hypothetical protein